MLKTLSLIRHGLTIEWKNSQQAAGDEMVQQLRELTSKSLDNARSLNILHNQVAEVNSRISSHAGTLAILQNQVSDLKFRCSCLGRDMYEVDSLDSSRDPEFKDSPPGF